MPWIKCLYYNRRIISSPTPHPVSRARLRESFGTLRSFQNTILQHQFIDHLKSAQEWRKNYAGPWLPELVITGEGAKLLTPLRQIADRGSISMAFFGLLESLSPLERA